MIDMRTRSRAVRRLAAALAAVGLTASGLTMAAPAASAQTPSPPGFSGCGSGGPSMGQLWDTPAVMDLDSPAPFVALRGTGYRYLDKIVARDTHYWHVRYDLRLGQYSRIGCKPYHPSQPKPRFSGGGGGAPSSVRIEGSGLWATAFSSGGMRTGTVTVGPPQPAPGEELAQ